MDFKEMYVKASDQQKLDFLDAIIGHNPELQAAFVNFTSENTQEKPGLSFVRFLEIVSENQQYYKDCFELVDLENPDWDSYTPSHSGYIEEWEQYQQASEQEFERIFEEFQREAINMIIRQKTGELTAMLLGLYEATQDADVPDPVFSFHDVNEHLLEEHSRLMKTIIEKIELSALSDQSTLNAVKLFFSYCDEEYPGNEHFAAYFEDLLRSLAGKCEKPDRFLTALDQSTVGRKTIPRLVLLLNQKTGNATEWLESAKLYYHENKTVAGQLLEHYFENNKPEFLKLAGELFAKDKSHWAAQLKDMVSHAEANPGLFIKVFYQLVLDNKSMEDYQKLRPHLTPELLENLLDETDGDKPFKVQILANEKRFEEIKSIVERNPYDWHYSELIRPILEVYSEFCFNHIKQKVLRTLENERGRSTYQRIVEWLQLADNIPGFKAENRLLAHELYNHKPSLPALRDELRKGGLV